jgi:putative SOS response-associated peptidase YedK
MCGRYTLHTPRDRIRERYRIARDLATLEKLFERYNVAPSQQVAAVRIARDGVRELVSLRWGLIPHWAKDPKTGYSMINTRAETVASKPAFRTAYRYRRCLIPVDGFYEWQVIPGSKVKQPWFIVLKGREPMAFADIR